MINTTTSSYLTQHNTININSRNKAPSGTVPSQQKQSTFGTTNKTDDNIFALESEQISKLFPKCRPKACDVNLNPLSPIESTGINSTINSTNNKILTNNMNNKQERDSGNILPNKYSRQQQYYQSQNPYSALYKDVDVSLRDIRTRTPNTTPASTVLNSPDLSDFDTKMHYSHMGHQMYHNQIKVGRSPVESCLDNSQIIDNYNAPSPISPTISTHNLLTTSSSMSQIRDRDMISDKDVVVFDDIGDASWTNNSSRNLSSPIISDNEIRQMKHRYLKEAYSMDESISSNSNKPDTSYNSSNKTTQKVIGGLQIADYEGSPRRFGNTNNVHRPPTAKSLLTSPSMFPPRPGFPKRVMSSYQTSPPSNESINSIQMQQNQPDSGNNDLSNLDLLTDQPLSSDLGNLLTNDTFFGGRTSPPYESLSNNLLTSECNNSALLTSSPSNITNHSQQPHQQQQKPLSFDYLYEFSETRKVLEEFFTCQTSNDKILEKLSDFNESDGGGDSFDNNLTNALGNNQDDMIIPTTTTPNSTNNKSYIGQKLAATKYSNNEHESYHHPNITAQQQRSVQHNENDLYEHHDIELFLDSGSRSSGELADNEIEHNVDGITRNFTLSPETTDYDSNCGDLDSEVSLRYTGLGGEFGLPNDVNGCIPNFARIYNSMPVLEDGLSSGHASDTENNNPNSISMLMDQCKLDPILTDSPQTLISTIQSSVSLNNTQPLQQHQQQKIRGGNGMPGDEDILVTQTTTTTSVRNNKDHNKDTLLPTAASNLMTSAITSSNTPILAVAPNNISTNSVTSSSNVGVTTLNLNQKRTQPTNILASMTTQSLSAVEKDVSNQILQNNLTNASRQQSSSTLVSSNIVNKNNDIDLDALYSINVIESTPPPPAPVPHRKTPYGQESQQQSDVQITLKDIRSTLQKTQKLPPAAHESSSPRENPVSPEPASPVWIPRLPENSRESFDSDQPSKLVSADEEEADTDLETDRLLGQQRLDDQGFYDEKNNWSDRSRLRTTVRSPLSTSTAANTTKLNRSPQSQSINSSNQMQSNSNKGHSAITRQGVGTTLSPNKSNLVGEKDELSPNRLQKSPTGSMDSSKKDDDRGGKGGKNKSKEAPLFTAPLDPAVLIEGVLFRARYLGSTQLVCEGQPTKSTRMMQAEEAVSRIKAPEGESQPSTEVDLFISTEKIMVLNTDLKEIMMDHALRTISYIADIGDLVVLMARRRFVQQDSDNSATNVDGTCTANTGSATKGNRTPKMICHVFESEEAQFIAQSIGQAFQVAYMEFLKANGIEDHSFMKEMDYQEVLNSQEIFGDELEIFAKKELQKEVVVPKAKGEILGVVIVESGWGSMLPTVVIANLASNGAAARCGQLNIGDQIIAINGLSLVGLPLSTCQSYIKNTKNQTAVKFTVVPCAPVVEVKIKRPNTKYQLGFSVQNGVICSLLRGGIAERGGVRVGHRIIEINNQSVVAVPHEKIVNLLATSVGEILMKTMPTSMFRLLTGQENPVYI